MYLILQGAQNLSSISPTDSKKFFIKVPFYIFLVEQNLNLNTYKLTFYSF